MLLKRWGFLLLALAAAARGDAVEVAAYLLLERAELAGSDVVRAQAYALLAAAAATRFPDPKEVFGAAGSAAAVHHYTFKTTAEQDRRYALLYSAYHFYFVVDHYGTIDALGRCALGVGFAREYVVASS